MLQEVHEFLPLHETSGLSNSLWRLLLQGIIKFPKVLRGEIKTDPTNVIGARRGCRKYI